MIKTKTVHNSELQHLPLRDLVLFVIGGDWGKVPTKNSLGYVEVKVVRGTDFKIWDEQRAQSASIRMILESSLLKRKLEHGDIVVEISGGGPDQPVGRTIIIDETALNEPMPLISSNFFRKLSISKNVSPFYLYYFFQYAYKNGNYNSIQTETTNLRNLQFEKFLDQNVPLTSFEQQLDIVDKLDELFTKIKSTQNLLEKMPNILKSVKRKILYSAFNGELTLDYRKKNSNLKPLSISEIKDLNKIKIDPSDKELLPKIPSKWKYSLIAECEYFLGSGTTPKGKNKYFKKGVPFFRSQNIYPEGLRTNEIAYISREIHDKMSRTKLKAGDILLNITGASIGRSTFLPNDFEEGNVNQHVCIIRLPKVILPEIVSLFLNSDTGQNLIFSSQSGVTREGLNYSQVRGLWIPLIPIEEQYEILKIITSLFKRIDKFEEKYLEIKRKISSIPIRILGDAFSGKLILSDNASIDISNLQTSIKVEKDLFLKKLKEENTKIQKAVTMEKKFSLHKIIIERFDKKQFCFNDVEDLFEGNYEELKDEFFDLIISKKIGYKYDSTKKKFNFSIT